jgi:hypothetical protein
MVRRIALMSGLGALLLATAAWTNVEIRGVVSYVDPTTRTVHFTDGRTVYVQPGATVTINGQPVSFDAVTPGAPVVLFPAGSTTTTVTTVTQPLHTAPPPQPIVTPAPVTTTPVNVTGTIASSDPLSQTITLQDGRVVRIGPNTMVWQQAPAISTLQPGARVFVRDALPVAYLPAGATSPPPAGQYVMGTVARVEPATQEVVLSNGTIVHLRPGATLHGGASGLVITQLRPGDEIVVYATPPARPVAVASTSVTAPPDRYIGSALPYQGYADTRIEAGDVQVIWSPQAR